MVCFFQDYPPQTLHFPHSFHSVAFMHAGAVLGKKKKITPHHFINIYRVCTMRKTRAKSRRIRVRKISTLSFPYSVTLPTLLYTLVQATIISSVQSTITSQFPASPLGLIHSPHGSQHVFFLNKCKSDHVTPSKSFLQYLEYKSNFSPQSTRLYMIRPQQMSLITLLSRLPLFQAQSKPQGYCIFQSF